MQETSVMGDKERVSCVQVHISADTRGEDGGRQVQSSSWANGADLRTTLSSLRSHDEDCLIVSPISNSVEGPKGELPMFRWRVVLLVIVCFGGAGVLFKDCVTYSFFSSNESEGVICVHLKEKAWERFGRG